MQHLQYLDVFKICYAASLISKKYRLVTSGKKERTQFTLYYKCPYLTVKKLGSLLWPPYTSFPSFFRHPITNCFVIQTLTHCLFPLQSFLPQAKTIVGRSGKHLLLQSRLKTEFTLMGASYQVVRMTSQDFVGIKKNFF